MKTKIYLVTNINDIGEKYVKMNKIDYEGSLDTLFQKDINKFIEYNIRDVEIIVELEKTVIEKYKPFFILKSGLKKVIRQDN